MSKMMYRLGMPSPCGPGCGISIDDRRVLIEKDAPGRESSFQVLPPFPTAANVPSLAGSNGPIADSGP